MKIFILDGNQRPALAIVRSLGKRGLKLFVGEESHPPLAGFSKYCTGTFVYPSPSRCPDDFIETIREIATIKDSLIIPVTDLTLSKILLNQDDTFIYPKVPFGNYQKYELASNKIKLFRLAKKIGVNIPETLFSDQVKDRDLIVSKCIDMGFPLVIKPFKSCITTELGTIQVGVEYIKNKDELEYKLNNRFKDIPFLLQEKINGPGIGIFFLTKDGNILSSFAHIRLREKPPSGGVSTLCESIIPPVCAFEDAKRLVQEIGWTGPVMVEFKYDKRDNTPKLMEVNARFWGSLKLSILAGVDFPYLLYLMSKGIERKVNSYKIGIKLRWELGDLDHFFIRLKSGEFSWRLFEDFFCDFFRRSVKNDVFQWDDPLPFFWELILYSKQLIRRHD